MPLFHLTFFIEHLSVEKSFEVDEKLKEKIVCKNHRRPDLTHVAILASTVTITASFLKDWAPYVTPAEAKTARLSSTAFPLKFNGRYDFARPVTAVSEISFTTKDGAEDLQPHDPLPPLNDEWEIQDQRWSLTPSVSSKLKHRRSWRRI